MPKSFAEDGALGAGGVDTGGGSFTSDVGGGNAIGAQVPGAPAAPGGQQYQPFGSTLHPGQSSRQGNNVFTNRADGTQRDNVFGGMLDGGDWNPSAMRPSLMFADGGEVPGMPEMGTGGSGDFTERLVAALDTVDQALQFGRSKHGLGGNQQMAGRMPTVPGNPSESGPRERPMPGPLPPTANPFGKRADAGAIPEGGDEGDDTNQQPGAIPEDEETA